MLKPAQTALLLVTMIAALGGRASAQGTPQQQARLDAARRELEAAATADPADLQPLLERVRLELTVGDAAAALNAAARAEALDPDDPRALLAVASALAASGAVPQAIAKIDRALEVDPRGEATRLLSAVLLRDLNRVDDAAALLVELNSERPDDPEVATLLGFVRLRQGDPTAALDLAESLVIAGIDDVRVDQVLGLALAALPDRREHAVAPLERAIAAGPVGRQRLRVELIDVLIGLGRLEEALAAIEEGLAASPEAAPLYYRKATVLRSQGDLEGASASLNRHQELQAEATADEDRQRARQTALDEAQRLALENRLPEALARIEGIDGPAFSILRAKVLYSMQQPNQALEEVSKARQARPGWAEANYLEGLFLSQTGRLKQAEVSLQRAAVLDPSSGDIAGLLAITLNRLGRPAEAIPWFEKAIAAGVDAPGLRLAFADALEQEGRSDEAADQLAIWRQTSP